MKEHYDDGFVDGDEEGEDVPDSLNIFTQKDIRRLIDDDVDHTSTLLSVPKDAATVSLCRYKWNINDVIANKKQLLKDFPGLLRKKNNPIILNDDRKEFLCEICLESYEEITDVAAAACGHIFCKSCWQIYMNKSVNKGRGCLMLRCPQPSCEVIVGRAMIDSLISDKDKKKYYNHLTKSYIEAKSNTKLCPAPGCDCAVEFVPGYTYVQACNNWNFDVTCNCSYRFCWNCLEEAHSPVNCTNMANWMSKINSENTKACPQCKRSIEKIDAIEGCFHMTCASPCNFQFCWRCLGDWSSQHTDSVCEKNLSKSDEAKAEKEKMKVKDCLEKYLFYHERWAGEESKRSRILTDMHERETMNLEKLSQMYGQSMTTLEFINDAWNQIVECRRVFKWACVFEYYVPENKCAQLKTYNKMQREAEATFWRFYQYVDKELCKLLEPECPSEEGFNDFRTKLIRKTSFTRKYFNHYVRALEMSGFSLFS